jgi:molybdenum cofactor cytidylyltransferase
MTEQPCAAIVLAAGASSRLGQSKQLVHVDGESLLRRTTRLAIETGCSPVFVVLGCNPTTLAEELEGLAAAIIINKDWETGMASSLKSGLRAILDANPLQSNAMVLVCDQPRLDLSVLRNLLATHNAQHPAITASRYRGTHGVPAIFSSSVFGELMKLTGDQGARRILQQHLEDLASVDFPGGEFDLDTPSDLARLNS